MVLAQAVHTLLNRTYPNDEEQIYYKEVHYFVPGKHAIATVPYITYPMIELDATVVEEQVAAPIGHTIQVWEAEIY